MTKQKAVMAELSKGRKRAPIHITRKNICMTSKVMGVSRRWHGHEPVEDKDGVVTHLIDWRILAAFEQSMGYPPVYMGELQEWRDTKEAKAALKAENEKEESLGDYHRRLRNWKKRYPEWWQHWRIAPGIG
jgi:hypothetical protein